jgi:WD40 repeat protein
VAVSPQGLYLVCGEYFGPLELWKLKTLVKVRTFYRQAGDYTVAFTPDGRYALTIASYVPQEDPEWDKDEFSEMRMWSLQTGELVHRFPCDSSWLVDSLAVTADSAHAVAGSHNGPLQVWDLRTAQRVYVLKRHSKNTYGAVLTEDRQHTMSCSGDEVIVWDILTGEQLCYFRGDVEFSCCACTVDGSILLAGDSAGGVHAFRLHLGKSTHESNSERSSSQAWTIPDKFSNARRCLCGRCVQDSGVHPVPTSMVSGGQSLRL